MTINHMRIDDRLIHGQIITAWITDSHADGILLADDVAAGDPTLQMILKLAVPENIKLTIATIDEAAALLADDSKSGSVLLIVRSPKTAMELFDKGVTVPSVNVGNISNNRSEVGRTKLLNHIFVEPDDVKYLKQMHDKGIELDLRAVPTDKAVDGIKLLAKNGF